MTSTSAGPVALFTLPYEGIEPRFATAPRFDSPAPSVLGKVQIGSRPIFAANSVVRADGNFAPLGDDFHLGEFSTV
jgi:hypothetical protein